jgi:hypothetical protein
MPTDPAILLRIAQRLHSTTDVSLSGLDEHELSSGSGARVTRLRGRIVVRGSASVFSVVAKSMPRLGRSAALADASREYRFYTTVAPHVAPIAAPACYDSVVGNGAIVLYLEDVSVDSEPPASLDDYGLVARHIGRFHARASLAPGDQSWALDAPLTTWTRGARIPDLLTDVSAMLENAGAAAASTDLLAQIVTWRERLLEVLASLPAVTCHNDLSRRNVFVSRGSAPRVRVIDWANIGRCAVGAELSVLIGGTAFMGDELPAPAEEVESATLTEYCQGLRDEGWDVDVQAAMKGYAAASALRIIRRALLLRAVFHDPANGEPWLRRLGSNTRDMVQRFAAWLPRSHRLAQVALDR